MKIFLTGAAGLIGSSAYRALRRRGWTVHGCDLRVPSAKMEDVSQRDLREPLDPYVFCGYDVVVHLAGHPDLGCAPDDRLLAENSAINEHVFAAALASGVRKIVFASTAQVFNGRERYDAGFQPPAPGYLPLDEKMPANAVNAYSRSKWIAEQNLKTMTDQHEIAAVVLRLPWVLTPKLFLHATRRTVAQSTRAEAFSFLMLADTVAVIVAACERMTAGYRCYFPAAQENLWWVSAEQARAEWFANVPLRPGFKKLSSLVDLTALERDLHWRPRPVRNWKGTIVCARNFISRLRQRK